MRIPGIALYLVALTVAGAASAQHIHGSPYSSMTARSIKALSDEQMAQLREGRGMGLSLPAELNSYPGPMHVIELASTLGLTPGQAAHIGAIRERMSRDAVALGEQVIAAEARLDRVFATTQATPEAVSDLLDEIGRLNGKLRAVHILAHMDTRTVLTEAQVARYDVERGYRAGGGHSGHR